MTETELEYEKAKQRYETFLEERKILVTEEHKQGSSFDKYLLTFATGTFGLTLTFIKDVTSNTLSVATKWMVITAWVLLAGTIILMLVSFLTSLKAYRRQIDIDEEYYLKKKAEGKAALNGWNIVTLVLNLVASAAFVLALIFLLCFVSQNMPFSKP